jgi:hypothetical protein
MMIGSCYGMWEELIRLLIHLFGGYWLSRHKGERRLRLNKRLL